MRATLSQIRAYAPCRSGWEKLLRYLGKSQADDEPVSINTIIDSNGLDDALWCLRAVAGHDREIRLYAVWCARQVQHLIADKRSIAALEVAERYAQGDATERELVAAEDAAEDAARDVAWAAAEDAARDVARDVARDAARDAAWDAARDAAEDAARAAVWAAARDAARDVAWAAAEDAARDVARDAARDAAWDAARDAAWAAARDAQEAELRRVIAIVDAGGDPYPASCKTAHGIGEKK